MTSKYSFKSVLNKLKDVSIQPSKFLIWVFMMLYGLIMFKLFKLAVGKLSSITSQSNALSMIHSKMSDILRLTNNYFIIFLTHIFKTKGLEVSH